MSLPVSDPGLSIFTWKGIDIYHKEGILKIGTDAILLATWVSKMAIEPTRILDVGCGSGVLAVLMGRRFTHAYIYGVDIQAEAVELSKLNSVFAGVGDRMQVWQADIFIDLPKGMPKWDLIISNPPFFFNQLQPQRADHMISKHTKVSAYTWMETMIAHLDINGIVCIVVPSEVAFTWIRTANEMEWYCQRRLDIYSFEADEAPKRTLLQFGKALISLDVHRLAIHASGEDQTQAYQEWLKEKR